VIIVPTLAPGFLLKSGDEFKGQAKYSETVVGDLKKAVRLTRSLPTWDEAEVWKPGRLFPTPQDVLDFCREAHQEADHAGSAEAGVMLGADVETTGEHPLQCQLICIGLGLKRRDGSVRLINVPVLSQGGLRYWAPADEQVVFAAVRQLLGRSNLAKVFHNGAFDCAVLYSYGIEVQGWVYDTMQAHHVVDSELPHGLGYVGSTLLDIRYWKDDVKGGEGWLNLSDHTLRSYNLRDVKVTLDITTPLHKRVLELGLWKLYQQEIAMCRLMLRATLRGMLIDTVRRDSRAIAKDGLPEGLGPRLEYKRDLALANLRQIAGSTTFDPQKPAHLQYLLFQQLGFPVVMQTATGIPATNKDALVLLALAADSPVQKDALRQLIDFKSAEKFKSTFVDGLGELADGAFHPSWKLLPVTGRLASSPNFQNLSKLIKRIFMAASGRKLVGVDLSQAELRYVAYLSGERSLLDMYKLGVNVHTANVALRLGVRAPAGHKDLDAVTEQYLINEVLRVRGENYTDLPEASKENWKPVRTLIKNDEFGRIYGAADETVFKVVRSKRDPETNTLLFPDVQLDEIEAQGVTWKQQRRGLVAWWKNVQRETRQKGYYQDPISGRIQWYRDGFKMNEMLNRPVQSGVAGHMNERTLEVQEIFDKETGGECLIVQQVHDALNADSPDEYAKRAGQVMKDTLSRPRNDIPGHPNAVLPVDEITMGTHLDEV
jgi:DNA polymerase I-like protein with 3'-5' exonuclease and polymerase domains